MADSVPHCHRLERFAASSLSTRPKWRLSTRPRTGARRPVRGFHLNDGWRSSSVTSRTFRTPRSERCSASQKEPSPRPCPRPTRSEKPTYDHRGDDMNAYEDSCLLSIRRACAGPLAGRAAPTVLGGQAPKFGSPAPENAGSSSRSPSSPPWLPPIAAAAIGGVGSRHSTRASSACLRWERRRARRKAGSSRSSTGWAAKLEARRTRAWVYADGRLIWLREGVGSSPRPRTPSPPASSSSGSRPRASSASIGDRVDR